MVEQFILNDLKDLINRGEDILAMQERLPHLYDMPMIDENTLEQYKMMYKEWRNGYDIIIEQLDMRGVAMNISKTNAHNEQLTMFLNVRDIHDQNRNITKAFQKHIDELTRILEDIDYVEVNVRELLDGYKRQYRYDDKKACEEIREHMLELLKNNPKKRYVLDLRQMNIGDSDLLENVGQLMFAPHSEGRIILEHRNQEDATIVENHLHKTQRNLPVHVETLFRELIPTIIMYVEE